MARRLSKTSPRQPPDIWAAANRIHGPETGLPGPRNPQLTPYIIPFQRAFSDPRYRRIVLCTGAQVGKTEALLDIIGERLDTKPAPIIYVGPSRDFVTSQFEPRLVELFRQSASLSAKVLGGLGAKVQRQTLKRVAGTRVRLAHAGSSTALKSDPAALCLVDELDEMLPDVRHQGSPLELVEARGATYADFVIGITSTPSRGIVEAAHDPQSGLDFWQVADAGDLESAIWTLWQSGTRHHWCWPCAHCGQYFVPRFSLLRWPEGATPAEARRAAFIECPNCGGVIGEQYKAEMNRRGRYVAPGQTITADGAVNGDAADVSTMSFWVSGLCSPFVTFGQRAEQHLTAVAMADTDRIRTTINAGFGELYSPGIGEMPEWSKVLEHCGDYRRGEVPDGVLALVMTCDVQRSKIFVAIRGWGARATSWLIDWGVVYGETHEDAVWTDLADLIQTPLAGHPLRLVLIDSGYRPGERELVPTNKVYDFCRRAPRLIRATKGSSVAMRRPVIGSQIEVSGVGGREAKFGLRLLRIDTVHFKDWLAERLLWPINQPGAWFVPKDIEEDYARQMVSETRQRLPSGRIGWIERGRQENHYFDCEVLQAAAGFLLNAARIRERQAMQPQSPPVSSDDDDGEPVESLAQPAPESWWERRRRDRAEWW